MWRRSVCERSLTTDMLFTDEGDFRLVFKKDEIKLFTSHWLRNDSFIGLVLLAIKRPRRETLIMLSGQTELYIFFIP